MIPVGAAAVSDRECVGVVLAWGDAVVWMPIHVRRQMQAVPVDDGWLVQSVLQRSGETAATLHAKNRILIALARIAGLVQQKWRGPAVENRERRRACFERQRRIGNVQDAERPLTAGDEQRVSKILRAHRVMRVGCEGRTGVVDEVLSLFEWSLAAPAQ